MQGQAFCGLTADVEPALVADAYRVGIVVQAVGTNFPLFSQYIMVLSISVDLNFDCCRYKITNLWGLIERFVPILLGSVSFFFGHH
jgi:hypothetical protein